MSLNGLDPDPTLKKMADLCPGGRWLGTELGIELTGIRPEYCSMIYSFENFRVVTSSVWWWPGSDLQEIVRGVFKGSWGRVTSSVWRWAESDLQENVRGVSRGSWGRVTEPGWRQPTFKKMSDSNSKGCWGRVMISGWGYPYLDVTFKKKPDSVRFWSSRKLDLTIL